MAVLTPTSGTTGAAAAGQFALGSISHFTLADASTDASTAGYLKTAVEGIGTLATIVQIGATAAGGWRFSIENNGATAAELQVAVRASSSDADVTVADFAY
tara:strand:- start:394 stop:696 length:303 start_codon:yes stop_codon:yes gene_type:complete